MFRTILYNKILSQLSGKINHRKCFCYKTVNRLDRTNNNNNLNKLLKDEKLEQFSLVKYLRSKISMSGPITVAQYMREVLTNPTEGYYMNKDVFGTQGDFITSPEIGQIFGELVAVWCVNEWEKVGLPQPLQIIELGPGRGSLAQDVLRVFSHFKLSKAISLHLVEISPFLSNSQASKLCIKHNEIDTNTSNIKYYRKGETLSGIKVYWYHRIEDVPCEKFSIVLAHEFFDALPIHKLQKDNNEWKEVLIDIDQENEKKFKFILSKNDTVITKIFQPPPDETRDHIEVSLNSLKIIEHLRKRFESDGGFGLIMDYGHFGDKTDTFRAFRNHQLHEALEEPGTADLTADVDFKQIKSLCESGNKLITFGPVTQRNFIKKMGGDMRLKILLENAKPDVTDQIQSGYDMLTDNNQMGERFKFFALFPSVLKEHLRKFPVSGFY